MENMEDFDQEEYVEALKKGPWTAAEDAILVAYVHKHGDGNWNSVQKNSGLSRCGKSCRLRWANHLRPNLKKGAFSPEEERIIIAMHRKIGNKWARIATQLPGRTDNEIKNYWNTRAKRRRRAGLPLYPSEFVPPEAHGKIHAGFSTCKLRLYDNWKVFMEGNSYSMPSQGAGSQDIEQFDRVSVEFDPISSNPFAGNPAQIITNGAFSFDPNFAQLPWPPIDTANSFAQPSFCKLNCSSEPSTNLELPLDQTATNSFITISSNSANHHATALVPSDQLLHGSFAASSTAFDDLLEKTHNLEVAGPRWSNLLDQFLFCTSIQSIPLPQDASPPPLSTSPRARNINQVILSGPSHLLPVFSADDSNLCTTNSSATPSFVSQFMGPDLICDHVSTRNAFKAIISSPDRERQAGTMMLGGSCSGYIPHSASEFIHQTFSYPNIPDVDDSHIQPPSFGQAMGSRGSLPGSVCQWNNMPAVCSIDSIITTNAIERAILCPGEEQFDTIRF